MSLFQQYFELFSNFAGALSWVIAFWWIWLPVILFRVFKGAWLNYSRAVFRSKQEWVTIEIGIPRLIEKGPKAMEQFFMIMHEFKNGPATWIQKFKEGEFPLWNSYELVSFGGDTHFYMHIQKGLKEHVETTLYSAYPNIDINEVPDYMDRFPKSLAGLYAEQKDLWGTELLLQKDDVYPIRSYHDFESKDEFENIDPIGVMLELLRKIKHRETVIVQFLARPIDDKKWQEDAKKQIEKYKEETAKGSGGDADDEDSKGRTPGEIETLKRMDGKISRPGFETIIRYAYIADKDVFSNGFARRGILSTLNQHRATNWNGFRHNFGVWTLVAWFVPPFIFTKRRAEGKKYLMYKRLRERWMPAEIFGKARYMERVFNSSTFSWASGNKGSILNTEELATLYHFPTQTVMTAPLINRQESKTLGPSAGLPLFDESEDKPDILKQFE